MHQEFFMLIGLPASGKSAYAEGLLKTGKTYFNDNTIIISSDQYREIFFKDINDQSHNKELFELIRNDIKKYLKAGFTVIYDACNISIKNRKSILQAVKEAHIDDLTIRAKVMVTPIETCYKRNKERDRVVPEHVIDRMAANFQLPLYNEGFDDIEFKKLYNCEHHANLIQLFGHMRNYDQNNPHHTVTLDVHCFNACMYLLDKTKNKELLVAALFHDIGKLYTKTYDEETGYCHFIGHENAGAYKMLMTNSSDFNMVKVAYYINYHMIPFKLKHVNRKTEIKYKKLLDNLWDDILLLHKADLQAH